MSPLARIAGSILGLALCAAAPATAVAQAKLRFSNWEFTAPPMMHRAEQTSDRLVLKLDASIPGAGGTLSLRAAEALKGALAARLDAEWKRLAKERKVLAPEPDETVELADGTKGIRRGAATAGGGYFSLTAYAAPGGGVNFLVLDARDEMAAQMLGGATLSFFLTLRLHPVGATAVAAESAPAPATAIQRKRPRTLIRTDVDFDVIDADSALERFVADNRGLLGRSPRTTTTFSAAMRRVEALVGVKANARYLARLRTDRELQAADRLMARAVGHLLAQSPPEALASLLVAHQRWPRDTRVLLNIASLLAGEGLAAESQAILGEVERRGAPAAVGFGIQPRAVVEHLRGYNLMSMGAYAEASAKMRAALELSPDLAEAALSLALLEHEQGRPAGVFFLSGHFRRGAARTRSGGYDARLPEGDPRAGQSAEIEFMDFSGRGVGLPAIAFVDVSKGQPGNLPKVDMPRAPEDTLAFYRWYAAAQPSLQAKVASSAALRDQLDARWRKKIRPGRRLDYYEAILAVFSEANARMPELRPHLQERDDASAALSDADGRLQAAYFEKLRKIVARHKGDGAKACPDVRALVVETHAGLMTYVRRYEIAERRVHHHWHQYATALAGMASDPDFRAYLRADIELAGEVAYLGLIANMHQATKYSPAYEACVLAEQRAREEAERQKTALAPCDEKQKVTRSYRVPFLKFEESCEGYTLAVINDLLPGVELSGEAKFDRDGWLKEHKISGSIEAGGGKLSGEVTTDKQGGFKEGKIGAERGQFKGEISRDASGSTTVYGAETLGGSVEAGPVKAGGSVEVGKGFTMDSNGDITSTFTKTVTQTSAEAFGVGGATTTESVTPVPGPNRLRSF